MYSAYKLNKQGDNIQPWRTPFPIWNQSVVSCPVLTLASWPAYRFLRRQVRWSDCVLGSHCLVSCETQVTQCNPYSNLGTGFVPIFWMTKLRHREMEHLAQSCAVPGRMDARAASARQSTMIQWPRETPQYWKIPTKSSCCWDSWWSGVKVSQVKTLPSRTGSSVPGQGRKIPHAKKKTKCETQAVLWHIQ